jgi:uncharacterized protein YrrD
VIALESIDNGHANLGTFAQKSECVDYLDVLDKPALVAGEETARGRVVRGVKVDFSTQRVVALLVSEDGRPRWQVELLHVRSVGGDEVTVVSEDCLKPLDYDGGRNLFGKSGGVIGARVISEGGEDGGKIGTFRFYFLGGNISKYVVSRGVLNDLFTGRRVIARDQVTSASPEKIVTL